MYELRGDQPMAEKCIEPDYEDMIKRGRERVKTIRRFRDSLKEFTLIVGHNYSSRRGERNYLAELLGTVEIDIGQREIDIDNWMRKMEEK
jgi:hypothetical protein